MAKFAWITLATNDSYSLGALVVAHSLKRVHTEHQLVVLITPGVSEAMKSKLRNVFNVVEEVNLLDSKDETNLALLKRPELGITFTKLHCWRLTQFEKCVFLDADTLVLRNCDELFEREELSAAPDIGWPDCFNSGVYVFRPSLETFSKLLQFAVMNGSFDGGDQGLLNAYFSDWAHKDIQKHLPFIYNTSSVATYSYLPAFKQFGQNTKILHFIGVAKPWLQNFNSETRKVHVPSECQHLSNFLQYWWDIFAEEVHPRLSSDMQYMFYHWMKPQSKVSVNQNRSTSSGTIYSVHTDDIGVQNYCWHDEKQFQYQQKQRDNFIPSYIPESIFVDPWEEYLQRQERDEAKRKKEEERLYFQYLNAQRIQQHTTSQEHEQLFKNKNIHQHSETANQHHGYIHDQHQNDQLHAAGKQFPQHHQFHHDENTFQRKDHWDDKMPLQLQENIEFWKTSSGQASDHRQEVSTNILITADNDQRRNSIDPQYKYNIPTSNTEIVECKPCSPSPKQEISEIDHSTIEKPGGDGGEVSGLAGALAQLHLGEAKSKEQEAYEEHMRRQCWETGNIDYMGRDAFDNIWKRIQQTLDAGSDPSANEASVASSTLTTAVETTRSTRRTSRSRSTTPKRDIRDRSPTPQPEDKICITKKEAHVLPPSITEEEAIPINSSSGLSSNLVMRRQTKLPQPIQYDPTTNTTTLTKKVFAGYQQIITTKNPEGKTRTHTKLIYDPSVEDDEENNENSQLARDELSDQSSACLRVKQDVVDSSMVEESRVGSLPITLNQIGTATSFSDVQQKEAQPEQSVSTPISSRPETSQRTISKPISTSAAALPVQPQQVAQESLAGNPNALIDSKQPVKAVRKKRHISPPLRPLQSTSITSNNQDTAKPLPLSSNQRAPATAKLPFITSPAPNKSSNKADSNHRSNPSGARTASIETKPNTTTSITTTLQPTQSPATSLRQSLLSSLPFGTKPDDLTESPTNELIQAHPSPPVPPRRKRESRTARIGKT